MGSVELPAQVIVLDREDVHRSGEDVEVIWFALVDRVWVRTWNRTGSPARRRSWGEVLVTLVKALVAAALWRSVARIPRLTGPVNRFLYGIIQRERHDAVRDAVEAQHHVKFLNLLPCYLSSFAVTIDPECANMVAAWRVVVETVRRAAADGRYPLNMVLEMRFIRNSSALLSPAFGPDGDHHCYLDLATFRGTRGSHAFFDEVAREWMALPALKARPHWAKYFPLTGEMTGYLHRMLGENLTTFTAIRDKLDPDRMFLNPAVENILYGDTTTGRPPQ